MSSPNRDAMTQRGGSSRSGVPARTADLDGALPRLSKPAVFAAVVRRSGPHVLEASLIPTALFYCCLTMAGLGPAYGAALLWLYAAAVSRLVRGKTIPPLLVLGVIGISVRTTAAVMSGSSFLYFAQPIAGSLVVGSVFLASIALGRPMVERLALEFWPLTPEMLARPAVNRLLRRLTFVWAGVNLVTGAMTLALLVYLPLPMYVATKQLATLAINGMAIGLTIDLSVRTARREGFSERPERRRERSRRPLSAAGLVPVAVIAPPARAVAFAASAARDAG
jgi:uncharacterized membrane protein